MTAIDITQTALRARLNVTATALRSMMTNGMVTLIGTRDHGNIRVANSEYVDYLASQPLTQLRGADGCNVFWFNDTPPVTRQKRLDDESPTDMWKRIANEQRVQGTRWAVVPLAPVAKLKLVTEAVAINVIAGKYPSPTDIVLPSAQLAIRRADGSFVYENVARELACNRHVVLHEVKCGFVVKSYRILSLFTVTRDSTHSRYVYCAVKPLQTVIDKTDGAVSAEGTRLFKTGVPVFGLATTREDVHANIARVVGAVNFRRFTRGTDPDGTHIVFPWNAKNS